MIAFSIIFILISIGYFIYKIDEGTGDLILPLLVVCGPVILLGIFCVAFDIETNSTIELIGCLISPTTLTAIGIFFCNEEFGLKYIRRWWMVKKLKPKFDAAFPLEETGKFPWPVLHAFAKWKKAPWISDPKMDVQACYDSMCEQAISCLRFCYRFDNTITNRLGFEITTFSSPNVEIPDPKKRELFYLYIMEKNGLDKSSFSPNKNDFTDVELNEFFQFLDENIKISDYSKLLPSME